MSERLRVTEGEPLRVLIVEDSEGDALLVLRELARAGYKPVHERVDTGEALHAALAARHWDLILCDFNMPGFGGSQALQIARQSAPDIPFVLVSGSIGEEAAVEMMKAGAHDYVMKEHLGRLGPVVRRELADAAMRRGMRRAQIEWTAAFDAVRDPIFFHDAEFRVVRANLAYAALARRDIKEVIGKRYWEVFPLRDGPLPGCAATTQGKQGWTEEEFSVAGGEHFNSRSFRIMNEREEYLYSLHILQDVTERNRVREALETSERRYRKLIEGSTDIFLLLGGDGILNFCSQSSKATTGWEGDEVIGKGLADLIFAEDRPAARAALAEALRKPGTPVKSEFRILCKDGTYVYVEALGRNLLADPDVGGIVVTARDIGQRKRAEKRLRKLNRALRTLSDGSEALVRASGEKTLLEEMCRIIVETGGYHMAWVGYRRDDAGKSVEIVAFHGPQPFLPNEPGISWGDDDTGQGATGSAIRTGERQLVANLRSHPRHAGLRDAVLRTGAQSVVAFPLPVDRHMLGALSIASEEPAGFDEEELKLLEELAGDLSFGIGILRARSAGRITAEKLRRSMESTVEAIAATVERRDPYTAGHEKRVAMLAEAIAREMSLPPEVVEGVHFGSMIHDLGKIQVPAEILSKPSKLSALEFELIKAHPQAGYEILQGIEFPWPVAQMVLQHHERLDGSGYPNGTKDGDIILEARILSVADVMEAMSSHRPYRPGLGIEAALTHIVDKRGRWFDPAVVDACVRLFRERNFSWS